MGYGINRKSNIFYKNISIIVFIVLNLLLLSIDSITRYLSILESGELVESKLYSLLRIAIFVFLSVVLILDRIQVKDNILYFLTAFSIIAISSMFLSFQDYNEFFKGINYTLSFVLIYRFALVYSLRIQDTYNFVLAINIVIIILLGQYLGTYYNSFRNIALISNDAIFSLIVFLPFLFFLKNKKMMLLFFFLLILCTLLSQKRSVIIFVNMGVILGLILYYSKKAKIHLFFGLVIILFGIFYFINDFKDLSFISSVINRFENSADNGREQITNELYARFQNAELVNLVFGFGYTATIKHIGFPSHNDFIEILYDYGIFAFGLYSTAIILIAYKCIKWFKGRQRYLEAYICFFVSYVFLLGFSLFNFMVFSTYNMVLFMAIGYSSGIIIRKLKM